MSCAWLITITDCMMQCTMQSHTHSVSTENNLVLMSSLLIGWRLSAETIDQWFRLLPVHLSLPVRIICCDQERFVSQIHVNTCQCVYATAGPIIEVKMWIRLTMVVLFVEISWLIHRQGTLELQQMSSTALEYQILFIYLTVLRWCLYCKLCEKTDA